MPDAPVLSVASISLAPRDDAKFVGFALDRPAGGDTSANYTLLVEGWVLPHGAPAEAVECISTGRLVARTTIGLQRPDIVQAFPGASGAETCGFRLTLNSLKLAPKAGANLVARFADGRGENIAQLRLERAVAATGFEPKLQPLLLTSHGRAGSTWLFRLVGEHPAVVAYKPFECEPRLLSYWFEMLTGALEPASFKQAMAADTLNGPWWLGPMHKGSYRNALSHLEMAPWWARANWPAMARFAQERVDAFYCEVARISGKPGAVCFAEKSQPGAQASHIAHELYARCREVVLVRDFRDVACSIFAFNKKRGYVSFNREMVDTDSDYIRAHRKDALLTLAYVKERADSVILVRYEDLVLHPEETLRTVFGGLDLDADEKTVSGIISRSRELTPGLQAEHATSPTAAASIGRWRHDLDDEQKRACEEAFGDILPQLGYDV